MNTVLLTWLHTSSSREACCILETHRELLHASSDTALQQMIADLLAQPRQYVTRGELSPQMREMQKLQDHLYLLRDIQERGSTLTAIREAYVNLYGGFVLTVPPWLEDQENLLSTRQLSENAQKRVDLLRAAILRASQEEGIAQEIVAELNRLLWHALYDAFGFSDVQVQEEQKVCLDIALQVYTFIHYPYQYARIQGNLGNAYRQWQGKDQNLYLDYAISSYSQALQVFTYTAFPLQYAKTQYNLGVAYYEYKQGKQHSHLEQAISCYMNALQIYTLTDFPVQYATLQLNLADIYYRRPEGEAQSNLIESIAYSTRALQIFAIETFPEEYARAQYTLGSAYSELGDRAAHIEEAIAHYKLSLNIFTIDKFPINYAQAQYALGGIYRIRMVGNRKINQEEAISCYTNALQIYTLDAFPLQYADVQHRLGIIYKERIAGDRGKNLEEAISCCMRALRVYTLEAFPTDYAIQQNNLGTFYSLRLVGERHQNLEEAIAALQCTLQVYTPVAFPLEHARTQFNLGLIYRERIDGERRMNLEAAISCYQTALGLYTKERFPQEYAHVQLNMGVAYLERIEGTHRENVEEAIACYTRALDVFTAETFPANYAKCQNNLALIYSHRIVGERRKNVEQAILHARRALEIYTQQDFPIEYAAVQVSLGVAYYERIDGERRTNQEEAISCYANALRVYTLEAFPREYALIQNNLSSLYTERLIGDRYQNVEEAIAHCQHALQVYTIEHFPVEYARVQHNLGRAYMERGEGEREANLEEAIVCYSRTLQVYTLQSFPREYALAQNNLGNAYWMRIAGERKGNVEEALAHYDRALQVYTHDSSPIDWAMLQYNLGAAYRERLVGERETNIQEALACYQRALQVRTLKAFPSQYRRTQLLFALTEMQQQHWEAAHEAYKSAIAAEDLLIALGVGAAGRDAVLKEGLDATVSDGLALIRLSRLPEAVATIEQGRTRGLAESIALDAADPSLISSPELRARYDHARKELITAQRKLNIPLQQNPGPDTLRLIELELAHAYSQTKAQFDAIVNEIRQAQDPDNFLDTTIDPNMILDVVEDRGANHALVYLGATSWGGFALAALSQTSELERAPRFEALDLPLLTEALVNDLIEDRIELKGSRSVVAGGFAWAQEHNGFSLLRSSSPAPSFRELTSSLQLACAMVQKTSMLGKAVHQILRHKEFIEDVDRPFSELSSTDRKRLTNTLEHLFLQYELQRALDTLTDAALRPLAAWLQKENVKYITLIPCGMLAAFPLAAAEVAPQKILSDLFVTSIAPSAQVFLRHGREGSVMTSRKGVHTLGNPEPQAAPLAWGEAEAYTLAKLARDLNLYAEVKVQNKATRRELIQVLNNGYVVDLSCHGAFNVDTPLQSMLRLARGQRLTLGQILSHEVDLQGLRMLILSACQTAILDLRGASDEVRSLAAGMLQAGADAVLASLWPVDDKATYLLVVRFAQEWFPTMLDEPPAAALARAQHWLRTVTNDELEKWEMVIPISPAAKENGWLESSEVAEAQELVLAGMSTPMNTNVPRSYRYDMSEATQYIRNDARDHEPDACPYKDPFFWAGFQIIGW